MVAPNNMTLGLCQVTLLLQEPFPAPRHADPSPALGLLSLSLCCTKIPSDIQVQVARETYHFSDSTPEVEDRARSAS